MLNYRIVSRLFHPGHQLGQTVLEGGVGKPDLGDDGGDESGRGYVKGRVGYIDAVRGDLDIAHVGDLLRRALLDVDLITASNGHIDGAGRRSDVEGHVVGVGGQSQIIGTNLIGRIPVGRHPVAADHAQIDPYGAHQMARRPIHDHGVGHPYLLQLPGRQAGPLQARSGLIQIRAVSSPFF